MTTTLYLLIALITVSPGETERLILDHSLTYEDCQAAAEAGLQFNGRPVLRRHRDATLECQAEE